MKSENTDLKRRTPIIIWCARLFFIIVIYLIGKFWLENGSPTWTGKIVFFGLIGVGCISFTASFITSRTSLVLIILSLLAIPFFIFLPTDIFVLKGMWWEKCIMFPAQMGIPAAVTYYMWKAPGVRNYYSPK